MDIHSSNDRSLLSAGEDRLLRDLLDLQPQHNANNDFNGNVEQGDRAYPLLEEAIGAVVEGQMTNDN